MTSPSDILGNPFVFKNGTTIKNRLLKSAMSEGLGDRKNAPTAKLPRLYATWAEGGVGLLVSGNVMIDERHLGEPRNVAVENESQMHMLKQWAAAGIRNKTHLWMQINHPGKQIPKTLNPKPIAPSAVPLGKGLERYFAIPREVSEAEIEELITRFAKTAGIAIKAGFTGVQIHGAHGYLVSQFLSPRHNQRNDKWGGSIENRARFALAVYDAIRREVGGKVPVSIKLNSADFQKGGFSEDDSMAVVEMLTDAGIDLIEISGGNYESPVMTGTNISKVVKESTLKREAFFIEFAEKIRRRVEVPLAVTGGFRSSEGMAAAILSGATDFVGLARPFAIDPLFPTVILSGQDYRSPVRMITTGIKQVDRMGMLNISWYALQLDRIGQGKPVKPGMSAWSALMQLVVTQGVQSFMKRRA